MQHHGEGLLRELGDTELVDAIKADYRTAPLADGDRVMLDYVAKLTVTPAKTAEADVIAMRSVGFSDEAILDINQITGFFAWCNRTVDGLGVQLEDFWDDPDQTNV
ncbi:peroxidase [bacterium]|nr:peroxidase [Acidimicrobiaceae bacterium]MBT6443481.1 peroxidase [Acidimicrobiaceae bacterium]MCH9802550.1 peroxidase [bacterium]